jgi:hypothetical protein
MGWMGARAPLVIRDTFPPAENAGAVVAAKDDVWRCMMRRGFHIVGGQGGYKHRPVGSDPLLRDATPADIRVWPAGYRAVCQRMIAVEASRYTLAPFHGSNSSHPWEGGPDHGKVSRTRMNSVGLL